MFYRKTKLYILLAASILLLAAFVLVFHQIDMHINHSGPFSTIQAHVHEQTIDVWYDEDADEWVLFLPSHAKAEDTTLTTALPRRCTLLLNGEEQSSSAPLLPGSYRMQIRTGQGRITAESTLMVLRSESIPTVYIRTESGTTRSLHSDKTIREQAHITILNTDGSVDSTETGSIRGHGNSTWNGFDKKPYNLYFDTPVSLLGMNATGKWVMQANMLDATHLRVAMAMGMAQDAQQDYACQFQHVDLYINDEYTGLYLLSQAVATPEDTALVERDSKFTPGEADAFTTDKGEIFQIHTYAGLSSGEIARLVQECEDAVYAHRLDGIDMDSFVLKFMIDEISKDPDAANFSAYYYLRDGILYGGPVWDYDRAFGCRHSFLGNNYIRSQTPECLTYCFNPWFATLYQNDAFYAKITQSYEQVFRPLLERLYNDGIYSMAEHIEAAAQMNQRRWHTAEWAAEVEYLRQWLAQRIDFLDDTWLRGVEYHTVVYIHDHQSYYAIENNATLADSIADPLPESLYMADGSLWDSNAPVAAPLRLYRDNPLTAESPGVFTGITDSFLLTAAMFALLVASGGVFVLVDSRRRCGRKGR